MFLSLPSMRCYPACSCLAVGATYFISGISLEIRSEIRGLPYSKFSFGEVYRQIYGRKFSFTATCKRSRKTWFPKRISDNIPPQMKILNMIIPILMHYQHFPFKKTVKMYFVALILPAAASCIYSLVNQWKVALHNDVGFPTVYHRIYCPNFMTLSNQTSRCIYKCIRIIFNSS